MKATASAPVPGWSTAVRPNWFTFVMGTGVVGVALAVLPWNLPGRVPLGVAFWMAAALMLTWIGALAVAQWWRLPALARSHLDDTTLSHTYGAAAMGVLTVGTGTLLCGQHILGVTVAARIDWALWWVGTLAGLIIAVWVPCLAFTRHEYGPASATGVWLMPVVSPMVSASAGALLLPHTSSGSPRATLWFACWAMFGLSLLAAFPIIAMVWTRLMMHGPGEASGVPSLWIVLGPLGQSITAASLLGAGATGVLPDPQAEIVRIAAVLYGVCTLGFALLWLSIVAALTARAMGQGLPFTLGWWSFTFPVGTLVTGATGLYLSTGLPAFRVLVLGLLALLLTGWTAAAAGTAHHLSVVRIRA